MQRPELSALSPVASEIVPLVETGQSDIALDRQLFADLRAKQVDRIVLSDTKDGFNNEAVAELARPSYNAQQIERLQSYLKEHGAFDITITYGTVNLDGVEHKVAFIAATETDSNHGEMSTMLYLRDHIQVSRAFMALHQQEPSRYQQEGKLGRELLQSALHLMSTPSQLERFENVIKIGPEAKQEDWPQISLYFNDLEGTKPNGWRNKQDTLQMLGHLTFDTIENGFIKVEDLTEAHKKFLGSLVPFLMSVGYPRYENSGSWEELTAVRTSVMAVETALLAKTQRLIAQDPTKFDFLRRGYEQHLPADAPKKLEDGLGALLTDGLSELGRRVPFESADHDTGSIKYREADSALVYVLMYDLPQLLAEANVPIGQDGEPRSATDIEDLILKQLDNLIDPVTGGMKRYEEDSYQRTNFHTHTVQRKIATVKQEINEWARQTKKAPNLDEKQRRRNEVVPKGREAAWTHPVCQVAAWAARRSIATLQANDSTEAARYRELSTNYLNQALRLVTGESQFTAALQADGTYFVQSVPANKLPECYITYSDEEDQLIVASPHTPLNWSTAMLREATGLLNASLRLSTQKLGKLGIRN